MKKTMTREIKEYEPCACRGWENCPLCKGSGIYVSAITTETTIEETLDSQDTQEAIDAEVVCGQVEMF